MSKGEQDIALSKRSASLFAAAKREHIPGDAQEKLLASLSLGTGAATIAAAASTTSTVAQTALRTKLLWVCTSVSVVALGIYGAAALRRAPATTPATAMTPASASTAQASAVRALRRSRWKPSRWHPPHRRM